MNFFKEFIQNALCPQFKKISRNTARNDAIRLWQSEKENISMINPHCNERLFQLIKDYLSFLQLCGVLLSWVCLSDGIHLWVRSIPWEIGLFFDWSSRATLPNSLQVTVGHHQYFTHSSRSIKFGIHLHSPSTHEWKSLKNPEFLLESIKRKEDTNKRGFYSPFVNNRGSIHLRK